MLDGHFVIEHCARFCRGSFFNFNGTAGVWRSPTIEDAGGWQHDTLTEDTDLSYRAQLRGWHFLYLPEIDCPSELPVEMNAFKSQQARWAKGLMQTAKKILPRVLKANVPRHVKAEAIFHLTANISYPLMVFLSVILLPAMIVRFYQGWFQVLVIDLPLFLASTCSISSFYLAPSACCFRKLEAHVLVSAVRDGRGHRPFRPQRRFGDGSDLRKKIRIHAHSEIPHRRQATGQRVAEEKLSQRRGLDALCRSGVWEFILRLRLYYAISNENYLTVPFLLLFVWGYLYTGLMSIGQVYFERLRFGSALEPAEVRPAATGAPGF